MSFNDVRSLETGDWVELYQIDLTELNNGTALIIYACNFTDGGTGKVVFDGNTYEPVPVAAEGFEISGQGTLPTPTFSVSNIASIFTPVVISFNDLLGAKLTRIRTLRKYLDGQPGANPAASISDVWVFDRKVLQDNEVISWELKSKIDVRDIRLPGRLVQQRCSHVYRTWDGTQLVQQTCPYNGTQYFDEQDRPTSIESDRCGQRPSSCSLRFGQNAELPFLGFPNVFTS